MKKTFLFSIFLSSLLYGDFTMVYQMDKDTNQIIKYKDAKHFKITATQKGSSGVTKMIKSGNKAYMIIKNGKSEQKIDMSKMKALQSLANAMGSETSQHEEPQPKIKSFGKDIKIAGINAQEATISYQENGHTQTVKAIVSKDEDIVDAMKKFSQAMGEFSSEGNMQDMFLVDGYAILKIDSMQLVKFDKSSIDDKDFAQTATKNTKKAVKKPPFCPVTGVVGASKQLVKMLKPQVNGWKLVKTATCSNMMKMIIENALYQKDNKYIHIGLYINQQDKGIIAKHKSINLPIKDLKRGKIQGYKYQSGLLETLDTYAMDIKLPNAMLTLTSYHDVNLKEFAKDALNLKLFKPVKKSSFDPNSMFKDGKMPSQEDMKKMGDMLKNIFGK